MLLALSAKAFIHRLYYDFIRELIVVICGLVIFATFLYVFNDFLNVEIKTLSTKMRAVFAEAVAVFTLCIACFSYVRMLGSQKQLKHSYQYTAHRMGETKINIKAFVSIRSLILYSVCFGSAWFFIVTYLVSWPLAKVVIAQIIATLLIGLIKVFPTKSNKTSELTDSKEITSNYPSKISALTHWRVRQIFLRNHLTQASLAISLLFSIMTALLVVRSAPEIAYIFAGFISGYFASLSLAFQLQEDLKYSWAEKFMGVSHEEFISSYTRVSLMTGSAAAIIPVTMMLLTSTTASETAFFSISNSLKLFVVIGLPSYITPMLMFQIDGRKPSIQAITVALIGLFLATAIYAHWLGIIALMIFKYYANNSQYGRFYRA